MWIQALSMFSHRESPGDLEFCEEMEPAMAFCVSSDIVCLILAVCAACAHKKRVSYWGDYSE